MIRPDETSEAPPCLACRGRGTKRRTPRRALLVGDEECEQAGGELLCLDCAGTGLGEESGK